MKVLITGICGFVGSQITKRLQELDPGIHIIGIDNLIRPGSELNRPSLKSSAVNVHHGDIRNASDFETLPAVDWVIDAAANPSVLAGVDGKTSSRQLVEHNLLGTINILEFCKRQRAGLVLLSTSRVYSIAALASLPLRAHQDAFVLHDSRPLPEGVSLKGIAESFPTTAPVSLYGATKLASEQLAAEYASTNSLPLWINRCGVLAAPGQFGTAEQGIFSYWIHAYAQKRPLRYIGFDGTGHQVRDAFHPTDLTDLIYFQITHPNHPAPRIVNLGGGPENAMSLRQLTAWCAERFGPHSIDRDPTPRQYDIPWVVMDRSVALAQFNWNPQHRLPSLLEEIADHARNNPRWLEMTGGA